MNLLSPNLFAGSTFVLAFQKLSRELHEIPGTLIVSSFDPISTIRRYGADHFLTRATPHALSISALGCGSVLSYDLKIAKKILSSKGELLFINLFKIPPTLFLNVPPSDGTFNCFGAKIEN